MSVRRIILAFFLCVSLAFTQGSNVITVPYPVRDMKYNAVRGKLYALVDALDPLYGNRIIEINILTGEVERSQYVGSEPGMLRLTPDGKSAWVTFERIPWLRRVDLNTFQVDRDVFLGPSHYPPEQMHRISTVVGTNFTLLPGQDDAVAIRLGLDFLEFEAMAIISNGLMLPARVEKNATASPATCIEPVMNGTYLAGHYQSSGSSIFSYIQVTGNGLILRKEFPLLSGEFKRNWLKARNDTLCVGNGVILDAPDTSAMHVLGVCRNNMSMDRYGFGFSEMHDAFIYPNTSGTSVYLTFYNKHTFQATDSVYLFEYPYTDYMLIRELEVLGSNRFAVLIGKDYGDYTVRIVEPFPYGLETPASPDLIRVFPNPAADRLTIRCTEGRWKLKMFDELGALSLSRDFEGSENEISTDGLAPGLYLVRVMAASEPGNSFSTKIIIR